MKSIKDIGSHKNKIGSRVIPLSVAFVILVVSTFPISSVQFINPAMAAGLTGVSVVPAGNIVNQKATYDIFLDTKTTGTIKKIEMNFPSGFDLKATRLVERSGIGAGSLSFSGLTLTYTISSAQSVPAGTAIRLEIGRIVATADGSFTISVSTLNSAGGIIDGPTSSSAFYIKSIERLDIDPNFMNRKTLYDDTAGHGHGWDPNGVTTDFTIADSDIQIEEESVDQTLVTLMLRDSHASEAICMVNHTNTGLFFMNCIGAPPNGAELHYEIHKLPANPITSTSLSSTTFLNTSSTISSPFSLLGEH